MSKTYAIKPNENWAENTSNKTLSTDPSVLGQGIEFQGGVVSNQLNGVLNKHSNAIRKSQAQGGLYDSEQIYNKNEFAEILTADNGIVRSRRYQAISDNTTASYPPVNGSKNTYSGVDVYSGTLSENPSRWARVLEDHRFTKSTSLSSGYGYTLCSNTPSNAEGTLKCRIYSGSTLYCSFDLEIVGGYRNFRINNVFYHDTFRSSKGSSSYSDLYYPGFALLNGQSGLYLHILSTSYANHLEVEFGTCNFIPPLTSSSGYSPSSSLQIQAIREGGGSMFIPNLGCIYPTLFSTYQTNQRDFALFQSGLKLWSSSLQLSSDYFHQYYKYGLRTSLSDPTNRYLKASSSTSGDFGSQSLPNIRGRDGIISGNPDNPSSLERYYDLDVAVQEVNKPTRYPDEYRTPGIKGAMYYEYFKPHDFPHLPPNFKLYMQRAGNIHATGAEYTPFRAFDASRSNSIYQDNAAVHPNNINVVYAIQAF